MFATLVSGRPRPRAERRSRLLRKTSQPVPFLVDRRFSRSYRSAQAVAQRAIRTGLAVSTLSARPLSTSSLPG